MSENEGVRMRGLNLWISSCENPVEKKTGRNYCEKMSRHKKNVRAVPNDIVIKGRILGGPGGYP